MSHEAFKRISERLIDDFKSCPNNGVDDVNVNKCLRSLGVYMGDSLDDQGRQRFLVVSLKGSVNGRIDKIGPFVEI